MKLNTVLLGAFNISTVATTTLTGSQTLIHFYLKMISRSIAIRGVKVSFLAYHNRQLTKSHLARDVEWD